MRVAPKASASSLQAADEARPADQPLHLVSAAASTTASRPEPTHIVLETHAFVFWWSVFVAVHLLLSCVAFGIARLYFFIADPTMEYSFSPLQIPATTLKRTGYAFAALGIVHVAAIIQMVWHSIRNRQFAFADPTYRQQQCQQRVGPAITSSRHNSALWFLQSTYQKLCRLWRSLFSTDGLFGLRGAHFDTAFEAREALEVVLQTYQAYNLSRFVPRRSINSLAVIAIVANCCATPLAHLLFRDSSGASRTLTRRVFCRAADMALDICCSVVIPFCIFYPYVSDFSPAPIGIKNELFFDDVWFINAVAEGRCILVTSLLDGISTLVPHASIFFCLLTLKSLLRRPSFPTNTRCAVTGDGDAKTTATTPQTTVDAAKSGAHTVQATAPSAVQATAPSAVLVRRPKSSRWHLFVHFALVAWGLAVGSLHLYAQRSGVEAPTGCKLQLNAWFTANYSCSVMEVNCYREQIDGRAAQVTKVLHVLDRPALYMLVITHCPALHIPSVLHEFAQLGEIDLFNCTIERWSADDAAIDANAFRALMYLSIAYSHMAGIPDALLHAQLPPTLSRIAFTHTNLSVLPDDLDTLWGSNDHVWNFLSLDACQLEHVPLSLARLGVQSLSLERNAIVSLPDDFFAVATKAAAFVFVSLSYNPLAALPASLTLTSIQDTAAVATTEATVKPFDVHAAHTNVVAIPDWLHAWADAGVLTTSTLSATPFCDELAITAASATANPTQTSVLSAQLCGEQASQTFPIELILPQRQP